MKALTRDAFYPAPLLFQFYNLSSLAKAKDLSYLKTTIT